jgi:di/tricarboxylate transporter
MELKKAGSMIRAEVMVAIVFGMTAILWATRALLEIHIPNISDTGIAIFASVLMFLLSVDFKKGGCSKDSRKINFAFWMAKSSSSNLAVACIASAQFAPFGF